MDCSERYQSNRLMISQEELSDVDAFRLSDKEAVEEAVIRSYILEHFSK